MVRILKYELYKMEITHFHSKEFLHPISSYSRAFGDGSSNFEHGQATRTTPELAPPFLTSTPTGERLSINKFFVHRPAPYIAGVLRYWARTHDTLATSFLPCLLGYRGHFYYLEQK
ncbi:hypothetical protein TNCV_1636011 [Trichonephila clavipes]|nr:hypothetical protein TNCV_1636011 [Trichonephila clavipes]